MIKHLSLSLLLIPALAYGSTPSAKEQLHEATQARLARLAQQQSDDVALAPIADNNATAAQPLAVEQPSQKTEKQIKKEFMRNALFLYVIKYGNLSDVQPWLDHGMDANMVIADPQHQDAHDLPEIQANELPILTHAVLRTRHREWWKAASPIIKALLAHGANPNTASYIFFGVNHHYGTWFTPLALAGYFGCTPIIKNLLSAGANIHGLKGQERKAPNDDTPYSMNSPLENAHMGGITLWHDDPAKSRRYWHAVRTFLHAGATDGWDLNKILDMALQNHAVARGKSLQDEDLQWQALLPVKNEDLGWLATLAPELNKEPKIRAGLDDLLLNDLINMVIDYTGPSRMHHDVEAEIFANIQEANDQNEQSDTASISNNEVLEEKSDSENNNNNTQ